MANPFDQFDAKPTTTQAAPAGPAPKPGAAAPVGNPFDQFDAPGEGSAAPAEPKSSWGDLGAQAGYGLIKGIPNAIAGLVDFIGPGAPAFQRMFIPPEAQEMANQIAPTPGYLLQKGMSAAHINPNDYLPQPRNASERMAEMAGEGAVSMLLPGGQEKAGMTLAQMAVQALKDIAAGAMGGLGAQGAMEVAPEPLKPFAGLLGGAIGGAGGMAVAEVPGMIAKGAKGVGAHIAPALPFKGVQERLAAGRLSDALTDPEAVKASLDQPTEIVPGSKPTLGQATGDKGALALEGAIARQNPEPFVTRREEQNTARVEALDRPQPTGHPEVVAQHLRSQLEDIDQMTAAAHERATQTVADRRAELPTGSATDHASALRTALEDNLTDVRARERAIWKAVDPEKKMQVTTGPLKRALAAYDNMSPEKALTIDPIEKELASIIDQYPDAIPFERLTDLRSIVSAAMRKMKSPLQPNDAAHARLTGLRSAIEDAISESVAGKVADEQAAVAAGTIAPADTLSARLSDQGGLFNDVRPNEAVARRAGSAGGIDEVAGTAPLADAGLSGAMRTGERGPAGIAGDAGVPPLAGEGIPGTETPAAERPLSPQEVDDAARRHVETGERPAAWKTRNDAIESTLTDLEHLTGSTTAPRSPVHTTMRDRFAGAGRPQDEADKLATLWDEFYNTFAARTGRSVDDLVREHPLPEVTSKTGGPETYQQSKLPEHIPGYKGIAKHLTPEERADMRAKTAQTLVNIFTHLPDPKEMAAVAYSGRAKRGWYRRSAEALVEIFGADDAPRFSALLAALSPQTPVEANAASALKVWVAWDKAGRPIDRKSILGIMAQNVQGKAGDKSVLEAWRNNTMRALMSEDPTSLSLSGPKVESFMHNLRGHVNEVTNDTWMANYALLDQELFRGAKRKALESDPLGPKAHFAVKGVGYKAMNALTRKAADIATKMTGQLWTPAEIQETVWSWARTLDNDSSTAKMKPSLYLKAAGLSHESIGSTPDFSTLFIGGLYRNVLEKGGYHRGLRAAERLGDAVDTSGRGGDVLSAEGTGFAQRTYEAHLRRAAQRLDQLRAHGDDARSSGRGPARAAGVPEEPQSGVRIPGAALREADGSLKGLPRKVGSFEASAYPKGQAVADRYMKAAGLKYKPPNTYAKVVPERATRIAAAYDAMKHAPQDPKVKRAYQAMADETLAQYRAMLDDGMKIEFIPKDTDPYNGNPRNMTEDVRKNNHMWVFPTDDGFGSNAAFDASDNPLLATTEFEISGRPATVNDIFRAVHDYFGHVKEGVGFRADGEENAWRSHSAMYSDEARRAMTSETRGQNSWVNYGPHGETNRTAKSEATKYADQKIGILPEWVIKEGAGDDAPLTLSQSARPNDTPEFKRWFGGSKVVDAEGKPLVVYHGSPAGTLDQFDPTKTGKTSVLFSTFDTHRQGFYFSEREGAAKGFAEQGGRRGKGAVMPVHLSIKKPLDVTSMDNASVARLEEVGARAQEIDPSITNPGWYADHAGHDSFWELLDTAEGGDVLVQAARDLGYDGIKMIEPDLKTLDPDYVPNDDGMVTWVAFDPTQIKSVNNRGTFDPNDPRLLFQPAWHGTPHQFDKFDSSKRGTGEGNASFGAGHYFAGKKEVAQYYRDVLSQNTGDPAVDDAARLLRAHNGNRADAIAQAETNITNIKERIAEARGQIRDDWIKRLVRADATRDALVAGKGGRLLKVDIPDDKELLNWDAPLSQQSDGMRAKVEQAVHEVYPKDADFQNVWRRTDSASFGDVYNFIARSGKTRADKFSAALRDAGIPGHRFLDQGSRISGDAAAMVDQYGTRAKALEVARKRLATAEGAFGLFEAKARAHWRDVISQLEKPETHNYVIYDDSRINVTDFEQNRREGIGPRAQIAFNDDGTSAMSFFKAADASSGLHESGHSFLKMFKTIAEGSNAPAEMVADWNTTKAWWDKNATRIADEAGGGVTPKDVRDVLRTGTSGDRAKDLAINVGFHEQWARAIESYLRDGIAPNAKLKPIFEQFKQWLKALYERALDLNVEVSPEMRKVFDRMLTTPDQRVGGPPLVDAGAAARLKSATAFTKQKHETFGAEPVKGMLKRDGATYPYKTTDAAVAAKAWQAGPAGGDAVRAVLKAADNSPDAVQALAGVAAASLKGGGDLTAKTLGNWRTKHADALRALDEASPGLSAQFDDLGRAIEYADNVEAARRDALTSYQKGAVGRLLKLDDPADVVNSVGAMLGKANSVQAMKDLVTEARRSPQAMEGLRRALVEFMKSKLIGTDAAGTIKGAVFQNFLGKNLPALSQVFTPEELAGWKAIAQDIKRNSRNVKVGAGSDTAQNLAAERKYLGSQTILHKILEQVQAFGAGALGWLYHPVAAALSFLGTQAFNALRDAGLSRIDDILVEAMLNPEFAKALLMKAPKRPNRGSAITFAQRAAKLATFNAVLAAKGYAKGGRVGMAGGGRPLDPYGKTRNQVVLYDANGFPMGPVGGPAGLDAYSKFSGKRGSVASDPRMIPGSDAYSPLRQSTFLDYVMDPKLSYGSKLTQQANYTIQNEQLLDKDPSKRFRASATDTHPVPPADIPDVADVIRQHEGFSATPYWDRNAWRIGYGSDTWTDDNGSVHHVTQATAPITTTAANRDLQRRIPEFQQDGIIRYVGQDAWDALPTAAQIAVTSLAYNYGSLAGLPSLRRAIQSGDPAAVSQAIANRRNDNGGINAERREREAQLATLGGGPRTAPNPASPSLQTELARRYGQGNVSGPGQDYSGFYPIAAAGNPLITHSVQSVPVNPATGSTPSVIQEAANREAARLRSATFDPYMLHRGLPQPASVTVPDVPSHIPFGTSAVGEPRRVAPPLAASGIDYGTQRTASQAWDVAPAPGFHYVTQPSIAGTVALPPGVRPASVGPAPINPTLDNPTFSPPPISTNPLVRKTAHEFLHTQTPAQTWWGETSFGQPEVAMPPLPRPRPGTAAPAGLGVAPHGLRHAPAAAPVAPMMSPSPVAAPPPAPAPTGPVIRTATNGMQYQQITRPDGSIGWTRVPTTTSRPGVSSPSVMTYAPVHHDPGFPPMIPGPDPNLGLYTRTLRTMANPATRFDMLPSNGSLSGGSSYTPSAGEVYDPRLGTYVRAPSGPQAVPSSGIRKG